MNKIILIIVLSWLTLATKSQVTERDKKFVKCVAEDGLYEVKISELAKTNALSIDVKVLANHMIEDHSKANSELKELAEKKGIEVPAVMSSKAIKYYDKLAKKQSKDFDKAYTKCLMMDHNKDICKFKKEIKKGGDTDIKAWAAKTLPVLEHHKEMIEETCKNNKEKK